MKLSDIFILIVLFLGQSIASDPATLKALFVVFRHGARAPFFAYDEYGQNETWPNGLGELTDQDEVESRSTDSSRIIESAKSAWYGFVSEDDVCHPNQVLPIRVDQAFPFFTDCPASLVNLEENLKTQNGIYRKKIKEFMGRLPVNATDLGIGEMFNFYTIFDDLVMKEQEGKGMPDWLTDDLYSEMKRIGKIAFDSFVETKALQKINAGPFLSNLKAKIKSLVANNAGEELGKIVRGFKQQTKKLNLYSTSDANIANLLTILQVYDNLVWPAATVIFELHRLPAKGNRSWEEAHGIRLLYFNETLNPIESQPHVLRMPVCSEDELCTLSKFFAFISDYTLTSDQWFQMCFLSASPASDVNSKRTLVIVVIVALALALLAALFVIFCRRNRKSTLMRVH